MDAGADSGPVLFYALNEQYGPNAVDAVGGLSLASSGWGSTNPWGSDGLALNTALANFSATLPAALKVGFPLTILAGLRLNGNSSSACRFCGVSYDNAFTTPFSAAALLYNGTTLSCEANYGGTGVSATSSTAPQGVDMVVGATYDSAIGHVTIYVGGQQTGLATASLTSTPSYTATSSAYCGLPPGSSGTRIPNLTLYWWGIWRSAFDAQTHAQYGADVNAVWPRLFPPRYSFRSPTPAPTPTPTPTSGPIRKWCPQISHRRRHYLTPTPR